MDAIHTIGVVGAGTMGHGIAQVAAQSGYDVVLVDAVPAALERGRTQIGKGLERLVAKAKLSAEDRDQALGRLTTAGDLAALAAADLVVEAVVEREDVKRNVLAELDRLCAPASILATNTSSISITKLAGATSRPEKVIGMHFMNPVPVMQLVEVIRGLATSQETWEAVEAASRKMGKTPVEVHDAPGFVSNRVLMPMINEAIFCLYEGVGKAEAIDEVMKLGMNHPMGPLALADLIGLDVCLDILQGAAAGVRGSQVPPLPAAGQDGRRRPSGTQVGPGLLCRTKEDREKNVLPSLWRSESGRPRILRPLPPEAAGALRLPARGGGGVRGGWRGELLVRRAPARADLDPRRGGQAHRRDRPPAPGRPPQAGEEHPRQPDRPLRPARAAGAEEVHRLGRVERALGVQDGLPAPRPGEARALPGHQGAHRRPLSRRQAEALPPAAGGRRVRAVRLRHRARGGRPRGRLQARPRQLRARLLPRRDPLQRGQQRGRADLLHARPGSEAGPLRGARLQRRHPLRARRPCPRRGVPEAGGRHLSGQLPAALQPRGGLRRQGGPRQGRALPGARGRGRSGAAGAVPAGELLLRDGQALLGRPLPPGGGAARSGLRGGPSPARARLSRPPLDAQGARLLPPGAAAQPEAAPVPGSGELPLRPQRRAAARGGGGGRGLAPQGGGVPLAATT